MNASQTPNLDYLRGEVDKLKALLDDPQPGLSTWVGFYHETMENINDFWNGKDKPEARETGGGYNFVRRK